MARVAGALAGLSVARALLQWKSDTAAADGTAAMKAHLRTSLCERLLAAGPVRLGQTPTGSMVTTLTSGLDALDAYFGAYRIQATLSMVVPLAVFVAVALVDPLSGAVLAVTGPLIPLFMWLLGSAARAQTARQWAQLSRLSARFLDAVQGLVTLQVFGRVDHEASVLLARTDAFREITMRVLRTAFLSSLTLELLATLGTAVVAVEVGLRLLYERLTFEPALTVLLLAPEFYRPLRALGASYHAGLAGREVNARVQALSRDLPPLEVQRVPAAAFTSPPQVEFQDVSLRYAADSPLALDHVSVTFPAGRMTAVLGPSGAGKTTILTALLRFVDPVGGWILADGMPIAGVGVEAWRASVSYVPQQPHLMYGTVRDNLLVGCPDASDADLHDALTRACAGRVLARLRDGLDTPVGDRGARLSGGEIQRLALARALLRRTPLLVLDEPTSELDADLEDDVMRSLAALPWGPTRVIVTHRSSAARFADIVVRIGKGGLTGAGA